VTWGADHSGARWRVESLAPPWWELFGEWLVHSGWPRNNFFKQLAATFSVLDVLRVHWRWLIHFAKWTKFHNVAKESSSFSMLKGVGKYLYKIQGPKSVCSMKKGHVSLKIDFLGQCGRYTEKKTLMPGRTIRGSERTKWQNYTHLLISDRFVGCGKK